MNLIVMTAKKRLALSFVVFCVILLVSHIWFGSMLLAFITIPYVFLSDHILVNGFSRDEWWSNFFGILTVAINVAGFCFIFYKTWKTNSIRLANVFMALTVMWGVAVLVLYIRMEKAFSFLGKMFGP